ncbi:MAG: iron-containing alcohol dehydrogenase [Gammaproteobacteria bacterium]|nr:iron-containing alcohol dehydrogenase [Gammaproteobacteria bacterium]
MTAITAPLALYGNWSYPTTIWFGAGRIRELVTACQTLNLSAPLLVTDPWLATQPMLTEVLADLSAGGMRSTLFSDIQPNPTGGNIDAGVAVFQANANDGVIGFGGGSAIDAAKTIALMSGQTRSIWDFEDIGDRWKQADPEKIVPTIAIPTTAGTGSEVGRSSVILQTSTQTKRIIFHPRMMPEMVILDASLTTGLPLHLTAATGMDALTHCFEAYCAPGYHPMADGIALEGLRLIKHHLPVVITEGDNLESRAHMLIAASMGATAFQKGLGAVHALSHAIGALYNTHHGLTNAIFLPYVMIANRPAIESTMDRLARWLGLDIPGFDGVLAWVLSVREHCQIPHTASALGLSPEIEYAQLTKIINMAMADPTATSNPLPLTHKCLKEIVLKAIHGEISK